MDVPVLQITDELLNEADATVRGSGGKAGREEAKVAGEVMQMQFLAVHVAVGKPVRCNDRYRVRDSASSSGVPQFLLIELFDVCWWRHGGGGDKAVCDCLQAGGRSSSRR